MLKKVFFAAAVSLLAAGVTMTAAPEPAQACHSGCFKKAKAKYAGDHKARKAYRKACKAHYEAWKRAHGKGLLRR